jgi:hypothetical protein
MSDELEKLKKFKQYVHDRLDAAGIDKHEEQNATNGCRIGARLNDLLSVRSLNLLQSATAIYNNHNNLQEAVQKAHQLLEAIELRQLNGDSKVPAKA